VPDATSDRGERLRLGGHEERIRGVNQEQGRMEGLTALVFLGLAVAGALAAAAARLPHMLGR
jgi:hypothetical protein